MAVTISEQLASFVVNTPFEALPAEAIQKAKVLFLDIIGVALAGTVVEETGKIAIEYIRDIGGVPESTVIGGGFQTSAPNAALANALLAHALDFDDFEPNGHPSGMLVASSLALGEKLGLSGKDILLSYLLGLEIYERVASSDMANSEKAWHATPVFGTLGSAAASAKALGLNVEETLMCLGIAASTAAGILRENGSMTKPYQVGKSARNGVEAALLAGKGFTSDRGVIENPKGFCDLFFGKGRWNSSVMTNNLGNPFHIVQPGIGIKLYPCGGVKFLRCIQGIRELVRENDIGYTEVNRIDVRVSRRQVYLDIPEPQTGLEGKFSMRYICARTLLDRKLTLETFTDVKVREPIIREALGKINIIVDETIPDDWLKAWSEVTLKLKNGGSLSRRIEVPKGDQRNPLAVPDVLEKFKNNASLVLPAARVEKVLEIVMDLDKIGQVHELMSLIKCNHNP
jgi:2-methylcitrate dehydratase PrpD